MTSLSDSWEPSDGERLEPAMVRDGAYVASRQSLWAKKPCPFCGELVVSRWMCLLSTYTIACEACDEVIESFELYRDEQGRLFTENHLIALGRVPEVKGTSWTRVKG